MPFNPPPFTLLRANTINLEADLSKALGRYKVGDTIENQTELELLINRVDTIIAKCPTARKSEQEVIMQLSTELKSINKKNVNQSNLGLMLLLGALFHRYFRLKKYYVNRWGTSELNCGLFLGIRDTLGLNAPDVNKLDELTIVTCLEVFQTHMLSKEDNLVKVSRYKKYPHLEQDSNFESHLKDIILEHKGKAEPLIRQFKAIRFLQSLLEKVELYQRQIDDGLNAWAKALVNKFPDLKGLTSEDFEEHLSDISIEPQFIKDNIADFLFTNLIKVKLKEKTLDHASFIAEMKKCNLDIANHILCGGYVFLLKSPKINKDTQLQFVLKQALGIEANQQVLTDQDSLDGLRFLKEFLDSNPSPGLNCDFFGNRAAMDTHLLNLKEDLISKNQKDPKPQPAPAAAGLTMM